MQEGGGEDSHDSALCVGMRGFFGLMHWRDKQSFVWVGVHRQSNGAHEVCPRVVLSAAPGMNAEAHSNLGCDDPWLEVFHLREDLSAMSRRFAKSVTGGRAWASQMMIYQILIPAGDHSSDGGYVGGNGQQAVLQLRATSETEAAH